MSVKITGKYLGNKKTSLLHTPSGAEIVTSAPIDNQGDGSAFSPTDLVAGALGACMMTVMSIVAERDGVDLSGMSMEVEKHMEQNPRRIGRLPIRLHLPRGIDESYRSKLERVAHTCPVHHTLREDTSVEVEFLYDV